MAAAAGREGVARRILERTVREFPGDPQTWLHLAEFELHHGEPLRALEVVRGALYLDPFSKAARRVREEARAAALAGIGPERQQGRAPEAPRRSCSATACCPEARGPVRRGSRSSRGAAGGGAAGGAGAPAGGGGLGSAKGKSKVPSLDEDPIEEYG